MKNVFLIITLLSVISSCLNPGQSPNKSQIVAGMAQTIVKSFPTINHITIEELQREKDYILVDVRSEDEWKIGHIPQAIQRRKFESNRDTYKDKLIVAYCTIGQRSSQYAQELKKNGFRGASLRESILGWTHRKLPLIDGQGKETKKVHVYSEAWNLVHNDYQGVWDD